MYAYIHHVTPDPLWGGLQPDTPCANSARRADAQLTVRSVTRGTVCYSRTASVGFVCIMAKPMATSQDFADWVCSDALDPEFLMHALIRSRSELREIATGATHKTIYMPQLAEADAIAQAAAAQLVEIEHLPQRLLAQAFDPSTAQGDVT